MGIENIQDLFKLENAPNNREYLVELKKRQIVPFVGAGVSMNYGFPGWAGFLKLCYKEARTSLSQSQKENIKKALKKEDFPLVAELLNCKEYNLKKKIEMTFSPKTNEPTVIGNIDIATLVIKVAKESQGNLIITSNYDSLIEDRLTEKYTVFSPYSQDQYEKTCNNRDITVMKLYGSYNDSDSIILTNKQYKNAFKKSSKFRKILENEWQKSTWLFIGCSLTDEYLLRVIKDKAFKNGERSNHYHYAILPLSRCNELNNGLLESNIQVIWYPDGKFEYIGIILEFLTKPENPLPIIKQIKESTCIGRETESDNIIRNIEININPIIHVWGAPGIGKSTVCHYVLDVLQKNGYNIYKFDAKFDNTISQIKDKLLVLLNIETDKNEDKCSFEVIVKSLKNMGKKTILYFDNFEDVHQDSKEELYKLSRKIQEFTLLVSSRNEPDLGLMAFEIVPLEPDASLSLFKSYLYKYTGSNKLFDSITIDNREKLKAFLGLNSIVGPNQSVLCGHPLSIVLVTANISTRSYNDGNSMVNILFKEWQDCLMSDKPNNSMLEQHHYTLITALQQSLDALIGNPSYDSVIKTWRILSLLRGNFNKKLLENELFDAKTFNITETLIEMRKRALITMDDNDNCNMLKPLSEIAFSIRSITEQRSIENPKKIQEKAECETLKFICRVFTSTIDNLANICFFDEKSDFNALKDYLANIPEITNFAENRNNLLSSQFLFRHLIDMFECIKRCATLIRIGYDDCREDMENLCQILCETSFIQLEMRQALILIDNLCMSTSPENCAIKNISLISSLNNQKNQLCRQLNIPIPTRSQDESNIYYLIRGIRQIGDQYTDVGNFNKAKLKFNEALNKTNKLSSEWLSSADDLYSGIYKSRARLYTLFGEFDKAIIDYKLSESYYLKKKYSLLGIANLYLYLGIYYARKNKGLDLRQAESHFIKAVFISCRIGAMRIVFDTVLSCAELYIQNKRFKDANVLLKYAELIMTDRLKNEGYEFGEANINKCKGDICFLEEKWKKAELYYLLAEKTYGKIARIENTEYQINRLALGYLKAKLIYVFIQQDKKDLAKKYNNDINEFIETLPSNNKYISNALKNLSQGEL